ncbi:hypothetical protein LINGRAHAP2_LOCUS10082, partial [Linum grandiflorum]
MSVEALDVYCDYINRKHVQRTGNVIKEWIFLDHWHMATWSILAKSLFLR